MKKIFVILLCALSFSAFAQSNPIYPMGVRYWYGDHAPGASETTTSGDLSQYDSYEDLTTGKTWTLIDATPDALVWMQMGSASISNPANVSLSFGVSRTPNADSSTLVTVSIAQTSTLITPADVLFQIDYGSGFVSKGEFKLSGIAASHTDTATFAVPAGASYKLINVSGTNSIAYSNEVNL